ncbi:MAG: UPF0758 domain-containing protein, partial [Candidatus Eisenbacteria bacterium]
MGKRKPLLVGDIPRIDRPRERLLMKGSSSLSDAELLAVIFGRGTRGAGVLSIADDILRRFGTARLVSASFEDLKRTRGIGAAKACQILACLELGRRIYRTEDEISIVIRKPQD